MLRSLCEAGHVYIERQCDMVCDKSFKKRGGHRLCESIGLGFRGTYELIITVVITHL